MIRTRIAPSPTGAPHIGTVYTAFLNYVFAKKKKGKFILRIEDTDRTRWVRGAEEQIIDALTWLGISWDEGPLRQSERLSLYQKYAKDLIGGGKAYYCFCSGERLERMRETQQDKGLPPGYDGRCRRLDPKKTATRAKKGKYVIRLKVPKVGETSFTDLIRGEITFKNAEIDDQILLKSDGFPTYHLAVVVDDHLMKITHVIRAEEWISSTPKHVLLYQAFGWKLPLFAHLPLLREQDRSKLSKRHGAVGVLEFRQEGYLPEALLNFFALLGWSHPKEKTIFPLSEFIKEFDLKRVSPSAPVFDRRKLDWMNGEYLRELTKGELARRVGEYLKAHRGLDLDKDLLGEIVPLVRERVKKLSEVEGLAGFFFREVAWSRDLLIQKGETANSTKDKLEESQKLFVGMKDWKAGKLEKKVRKMADDQGWRTPTLFMTLRVAITGQKVSPPLFESMAILGRKKTTRRIKRAISIL
jgi:glutamyl-tRNA synthetase